MRVRVSRNLTHPPLCSSLISPLLLPSQERAKALHRELMYDGVHVDSIHSEQSHAARSAAVDNFRLGRTWLLVATDLIGRGMDFIGVQTVVNYDFPSSTADYIHRVGRTGRAGHQGRGMSAGYEQSCCRDFHLMRFLAGGALHLWRAS